MKLSHVLFSFLSQLSSKFSSSQRPSPLSPAPPSPLLYSASFLPPLLHLHSSPSFTHPILSTPPPPPLPPQFFLLILLLYSSSFPLTPLSNLLLLLLLLYSSFSTSSTPTLSPLPNLRLLLHSSTSFTSPPDVTNSVSTCPSQIVFKTYSFILLND